jgi:hypothetical protein
VPHQQQQQRAVQPPQPQPPSPHAAQQHMRNEHELVRVLLSILPDDPNQATPWGDGQELQVNIALTPLDWSYYQPHFGSVQMFMQARPAVFGEAAGGPPGRFFKHAGAEEMVRHAEAQQEADAAAAAAAGSMPPGPWPPQAMHGEQQQQPQHMQQQPPPGYGLPPDSGFLPEQQQQQPPQQLMAPEQQGAWGHHGMVSMPQMLPAGVPGMPMPSMPMPVLSMPFAMAPHQLGGPMAMSMPMAPPSMLMGQQQQHHPGMHHPHPQGGMHHGAGGW